MKYLWRWVTASECGGKYYNHTLTQCLNRYEFVCWESRELYEREKERKREIEWERDRDRERGNEILHSKQREDYRRRIKSRARHPAKKINWKKLSCGAYASISTLLLHAYLMLAYANRARRKGSFIYSRTFHTPHTAHWHMIIVYIFLVIRYWLSAAHIIEHVSQTGWHTLTTKT